MKTVATLISRVITGTDFTPDAPAEVKAGMDKIGGLVMYISLSAVAMLLVAAGIWAWAGNNGHGSGVSPEMQKRVSSAVIALVVIAGASGIVKFFS